MLRGTKRGMGSRCLGRFDNLLTCLESVIPRKWCDIRLGNRILCYGKKTQDELVRTEHSSYLISTQGRRVNPYSRPIPIGESPGVHDRQMTCTLAGRRLPGKSGTALQLDPLD